MPLTSRDFRDPRLAVLAIELGSKVESEGERLRPQIGLDAEAHRVHIGRLAPHNLNLDRIAQEARLELQHGSTNDADERRSVQARSRLAGEVWDPEVEGGALDLGMTGEIPDAPEIRGVEQP